MAGTVFGKMSQWAFNDGKIYHHLGYPRIDKFWPSYIGALQVSF